MASTGTLVRLSLLTKWFPWRLYRPPTLQDFSYPRVNYWKWAIEIVDLPIKRGDFPYSYGSSPEGTYLFWIIEVTLRPSTVTGWEIPELNEGFNEKIATFLHNTKTIEEKPQLACYSLTLLPKPWNSRIWNLDLMYSYPDCVDTLHTVASRTSPSSSTCHSDR